MKSEISSNNKLVIIGNGFDLAHGMKTSYIDFFNDVMLDLYVNYSNFKPCTYPFYTLNVNTSRSVFPDVESFEKKLSHIINSGLIIKNNNLFSDLFIGGKNIKNAKWSNIELNYFNHIKRIFKEGNHSEIKKLNSDFEIIKDEFRKYLIRLPKLTNEVKNNYLANIIFPKYIFTPLRARLNLVSHNVNPIQILNFNYTETFKFYIREDGMDFNNIHGNLNDPNNPIIFGYGDETDEYYNQIENLGDNEFLKHFKSFGYFKTENYQKLIRFLDLDKFDVLILGHSCGLSDRVMLKTIFEHQNCEQIQIFYHQWGLKDSENDFETKTMEISRHFSNKAEMRKIVVSFEKSIPIVPFKSKK